MLFPGHSLHLQGITACCIHPHSLLHPSVLSPCCIHPHSLLIHTHSLLIHPEPLCPALGLQRAGRGLTSCLSWEQNNFCSDPEQRGWLGCPWQGAAQCSPWMGNAFFGRTPALAVLLINFSAGTNYGPQVLLTCCVFHVPAPFLPSACFCFSFSCADSSAQARQVLGCASGSSAAAAAAAPPSPVCGSPCQDRQAQRGAGIEAAEREQGLHCESHIQLSPAPAFSPGTETSSWFWPFELLFWGAWFPPVVMQEPRVSSLPGKLHPQLSMELPTCSQDRSRLDPPSHTEGVHWVPSLQAQQPLRLGPRAFSRLQKPESHTLGSSGSPR